MVKDMRIIKIGAMWCPACLIVNNHLNDIIKKYDIDLVNFDYDFDEEEIKKYNVGDTLPVLIFIKNDMEIERLIGEKSYKEIEGVILRYEEV